MPTLSVKLDEQSRSKVQALASQQGVTPHAFMVRAIESAVARSEVEGAWVARALLARKNMEQTGMVVDGLAMAKYLKDKVRGRVSQRPVPEGLEQLLTQGS
jgi:predicted transcriptional regulator